MAKPNREEQLQLRLEEAKKKLKLDDGNPFQKVRKNTRQEVLNKNPNTTFNVAREETEQEIREQIKESVLEQSEKEFYIPKDKQIYNEITEKSKELREEKKLATEELEKNIMKFDEYTSQIAKILPQKQTIIEQNKPVFDENTNLVQAQKLKITQSDILKQGAFRLEELQRERQSEIHALNLGDDDDFGDIKSDISATNEISDFSEHEDKELHISDSETEIQVPIEQIPYILEIPANFREFEKLLNSVLPEEEIILYDRMIKSNSTVLDENNVSVCQRLAEFTFKRFVHTTSLTRMDCAMRCLKHLATEIPVELEQIFKNYFEEYKECNFVQFALVVRLFSICDFEYKFSENHLGNVQELIFVTAEDILQRELLELSVKNCYEILFFIQNLAILSINYGKFEGMVLYTCYLLVDFLHKCELSTSEINELSIEDLFSGKVDEISLDFAEHNIELLVGNYCVVFGVTKDLLTEELEKFCPQELLVDNEVNFVYDKAPEVQEYDPVYAMNFNPKRGLDPNLERVKMRACEKAEEKKQRDEIRRVLREKRDQIKQREIKAIDKEKQRKKAMGEVEGFYQQEVATVKNLQQLEKLSKGRK